MEQKYGLEAIASQVRRDIIRMVYNASSGHPGGSMSSTDIVVALFFKEMKHSPKNWRRDGVGSDLFFLSAGHMSPLFYSVLARSGYFPLSYLATFRKLGSPLQGHPSTDQGLPGIHIASGSLGQGLSVANGAAVAKKMNGEENFVYVLLGDGECQEGQVWEAALFAAHNRLNRLIAITDWNGQQIDGRIDDIMGMGDLTKKWEAFGWSCREVEGNNMNSLLQALEWAKGAVADPRPKMLLLNTTMGKGVDFMEDDNRWHGVAPSEEQCRAALEQLPETIGDF
ncbi:MAG: transketolase [Bacteroidales bacterium]